MDKFSLRHLLPNGRRKPPQIATQFDPTTFTARITDAFAKVLADNGLGRYVIFGDGSCLLHPELNLDEQECPRPVTWRPLTGFENRLHDYFQFGVRKPEVLPSGYLLLPHLKIAVLRLSYYSLQHEQVAFNWFYAAENPTAFDDLITRIEKRTRVDRRPSWQVITGTSGELISRSDAPSLDDVVISPNVRSHIECQILPFFTESTKRLYSRLKIPYRRGLLLHGKAGNGKTTLLKVIAKELKDVACFFLQPSPSFDDNDFRTAIERWVNESPSILAVEDIDWLLPRISLSTFLNLLDGVTQKHAQNGLLFVATTNHPERLDPAISNRAGRFDSVLEIGLPSRELRLKYFEKQTPELTDAQRLVLANQTSNCSFAHLREVILSAGHLALAAGREDRTFADYEKAAEVVAGGQQFAATGFNSSPSADFGFAEAIASRRGGG